MTPPKKTDLYGKFDPVLDAVLGVAEKPKKTVIKNMVPVESWSVPLQEIYDNKDVRLDACHYDQETYAALEELTKSGFPLEPLSDMADIILPGMFTRIWAQDASHGIPYINATDLMSLVGLGTLTGNTRYLSRETNANLNELIVHEGWILMSCSGTIGRVFYVPKRMDGWVGTHDILRIIPKKGTPVGYLHAYLSSVVAQKQILGHTHGGQIDHVTDKQIGSILVPRIPDDRMQDIHKKTMQALKYREQAIQTLSEIADDTEKSIKEGSGRKHGNK